MQVLPTRAGRRSLAQTIVILTATAVLGACGDEATAPVSALVISAAGTPAPEQLVPMMPTIAGSETSARAAAVPPSAEQSPSCQGSTARGIRVTRGTVPRRANAPGGRTWRPPGASSRFHRPIEGWARFAGVELAGIDERVHGA